MDASPYRGGYWVPGEELIEGGVYTVRASRLDDDGDVILDLLEVSRSQYSRRVLGDSIGYGAYRFRPLITQADDIAKFTHLLNTTDEVVDA